MELVLELNQREPLERELLRTRRLQELELFRNHQQEVNRKEQGLQCFRTEQEQDLTQMLGQQG